jgi:hypothetical protein
LLSPLPQAHAIVDHVRPDTTEPADPAGMGDWRATGLIDDPSRTKKQVLTRMHAIRGKFGGPGRADNMFLGTALSNNFSSASHFKLVEQPLEKYLTGRPRGETRAFEYWVEPRYGQVPRYISGRIDHIRDGGERGRFQTFAAGAIPDGFQCYARFYRQVGGTVFATGRRQQLVATDVGAPQSAPAVLTGPIGGSVLAPAVAHTLGSVASSVLSSADTTIASVRARAADDPDGAGTKGGSIVGALGAAATLGVAGLAASAILPALAVGIGGGLLARYFTRSQARKDRKAVRSD